MSGRVQIITYSEAFKTLKSLLKLETRDTRDFKKTEIDKKINDLAAFLKAQTEETKTEYQKRLETTLDNLQRLSLKMDDESFISLVQGTFALSHAQISSIVSQVESDLKKQKEDKEDQEALEKALKLSKKDAEAKERDQALAHADERLAMLQSLDQQAKLDQARKHEESEVAEAIRRSAQAAKANANSAAGRADFHNPNGQLTEEEAFERAMQASIHESERPRRPNGQLTEEEAFAEALRRSQEELGPIHRCRGEIEPASSYTGKGKGPAREFFVPSEVGYDSDLD